MCDHVEAPDENMGQATITFDTAADGQIANPLFAYIMNQSTHARPNTMFEQQGNREKSLDLLHDPKSSSSDVYYSDLKHSDGSNYEDNTKIGSNEAHFSVMPSSSTPNNYNLLDKSANRSELNRPIQTFRPYDQVIRCLKPGCQIIHFLFIFLF